jgi:hypothetical protein
MRLKQYLITERRSKELSKNEAVDILFDNCQNAVKDYENGYKLYRGLYKPAGNYALVDPKSGKPRKSAYATYNYYTLFIDNLPSWRQYPKRSESLICTTSYTKAVQYTYDNNPYIVFPYDNAKLAVAPTDDIFTSFKIYHDNTYNLIFGTGREFNEFLEWFFDKITGIDDASSNWNRLKKAMNIFDKEWKTGEAKEDIENTYNSTYTRHLYESIVSFFEDNYKGNMLKMFDKLLNPDYNGFRLTKKISQIPDDREVWTDSKCLMIRSDEVEDFLDSDASEVDETYASMDFIPKLPIKDIGIEDDIIRTSYQHWLYKYIDNNKKLPDTVDVKRTFDDDNKYIIDNNYENALAIIRACFKRQKWVQANVTGYESGLVHDEWKIQPNKKFFGLEEFADEESLEYDLEELKKKKLL